ncbi:FAD-dependent monooxygenase [Ramlibacter albus]|uniref:FAD-dependent monooxygenase n=1 Tax=Ramlibacter albus TaxID=2079448 RepID=A0A923M8B1_9BURK|nr:FAD-dependent monooxygenase [Ramlibacter albus]MBC5765840.1 FAD-dependent monooxygenase [Ramlibacter albus]
MAQPHVAVVGAGLGGLTAAAALHRKGIPFTVLEQASELGEIGAGVQLAPNALKVLRALGLEQRAAEVGFEPDAHVVRNWQTADVLAYTPYKGTLSKVFGAAYYGYHRADLHEILRSAVPSNAIQLKAKCTGVREDGDKAVVMLSDGSELKADVVIGADGIHSAVRASLFGPEAPRYTGNACWRGLTPTFSLEPGLIQPDMTVWFGPGASIVHYYIRGGTVVNWVAMFESETWAEESWTARGDKAEMMARFADWHPTMRALLQNSGPVLKWGLFDRDPLPQWSKGRATLMGDACHPMLPYLAQGACQAIEDGWAVAAAIERGRDDIPAALKAYEAQRRDRTARVQMTARARAVENHTRDEAVIRARDERFAKARAEAAKGKHAYGIEWIYEHDVTAV